MGPTGARPAGDSTAADPLVLPERRVVNHVHRRPGGAISAVCAGAAGGTWSPRAVDDVVADLSRGGQRYVVSWLGEDRPVVALPRPDGDRHLHSTHPSGAGNALDVLPICPVHVDGLRLPRPDEAVIAACRARHPSSWPPRLLPPV